MWYCLDCKKQFENPNYEFSKYIKGKLCEEAICPFCGSELVADYSDFHFPKMEGGLVPQVGKDSFQAAMEHPNCPCISNFEKGTALLGNDAMDYFRKRILIQSPISFNDLDINELVLLESAVLEENEGVVRPMTYITEMTERFLHTFINVNFVPA